MNGLYRWRTVLALVLWLLTSQTVLAHSGGTPRLTNAPVGPYRLYAWSDPEPWRAGQVHLSVVVTQPADNAGAAPGSQVEAPVTDATVTTVLTPLDPPGQPITVQAVPQETLGTLYYEVSTTLPAAGRWGVTVQVAAPKGGGDAEFEVTALPARTLNWWLVGGAGVTLLVIVVLMGIWSRTHPSAPATPRRARRRVAPQTPGEGVR